MTDPYRRLLSEVVYLPGDFIDWAVFASYGLKPRIRVKMGRA